MTGGGQPGGPDATWWITDVLFFAVQLEDWREDDQAPIGWSRAQLP
jgi:hypothetical protein